MVEINGNRETPIPDPHMESCKGKTLTTFDCHKLIFSNTTDRAYPIIRQILKSSSRHNT